MAITTSVICNSFKKELFEGTHNFKSSGGNSFKLALYTNSAVLGKSTTSYTTDAQISNTGQYTAGGGALTNGGTSVATNVAIVDFADRSFTGVTLTARGALIYNDTASGDPAVCVLNFGGDKTATSGTFTIQFPAFTTAAAILRIT
tara:strand:+ start:91 stop:528 length:438 start_codon:yes stop_codon:yes gene_type:complete